MIPSFNKFHYFWFESLLVDQDEHIKHTNMSLFHAHTTITLNPFLLDLNWYPFTLWGLLFFYWLLQISMYTEYYISLDKVQFLPILSWSCSDIFYFLNHTVISVSPFGTDQDWFSKCLTKSNAYWTKLLGLGTGMRILHI